MLDAHAHAPPPSAPAGDDDDEGAATFRDIHPLATAPSWDATSQRSLSSSDDQFMTMSREFTAMVAAGSTMHSTGDNNITTTEQQLASIGEGELEEANPLAIVPGVGDTAVPPPTSPRAVEVGKVKKEELETKVAAWQAAETAKIGNRFKTEEVVINGWEAEQVEKATAWLNKVERKLDEKRAKAMEKAQNDIAKARRKAEERRASAEAKRGVKIAKVLELANFMKAVGRVPTKRSFF